jgi:uncharacterized protein (DUF58 family)
MRRENWLALLVVLIFVSLVLGLPELVALSGAALAVVPVAHLWSRWSLRRVSYQRRFSERRAFPGEVVEITVGLRNEKLLPLSWLTVTDTWPLGVALLDRELATSPNKLVGYLSHAFAIRGREGVQRRYHLRCVARGFYAFGPARLVSGDLFGLFEQERWDDQRDWLIVYPELRDLVELGLPPKEPFGETRADLRIFEDPSRAVGVRDYQPEDSFRHVHWKASARRQALQVKVYEPTTSFNLIVFLNVATFARYWEGVDPEKLERAISVAASIANYAAAERYVVGLVANGSVPGSDQAVKVPAGRSPYQLMHVLEALAAVTSFSTTSIEHLLLSESPRLPWGATLVVVTTVVTEPLLTTLVRLRDVGRRLVLISLAQEPLKQELPGILTYHLPGSEASQGAPPPKARPAEGTAVPAAIPAAG